MKFEHFANQACAHLEGGNIVYCMIPGGSPWLEWGADKRVIRISDAPQCQSMAEFKAFVKGRFVPAE